MVQASGAASRITLLVATGLVVCQSWACGARDAGPTAGVRAAGGDVRENEAGRVDYLFFEGPATTDATLKSLAGDVARLSAVRRVQLLGTSVTGPGLDILIGLSSLQAIDLSGSPVTDAGLKPLATLSGLVNLNLSRTQVTAAGLAQLHGLPKLRILDLSGCRLTDDGVAGLAAIKSLKSVRLVGSGISAKAIAKLQADLPGVSVVAR